MLATLAGVVHDYQRADSHEHKRDEDNEKGTLHGDLAPPAAHRPATALPPRSNDISVRLNVRLGAIFCKTA
jgi:hypothetical protein